MSKPSKEEILKYHHKGKINISTSKKLTNQTDLAIAYTPGVSLICEEIEKDLNKTWDLTTKSNNVAVVTDGTAVLGLGNIGPEASIPVMEGKAALFKTFANIDAWPVPLKLNIKSPNYIDEFIETVKSFSCMYGGINLEDIAAPNCFEIEKRLDEALDIPVFHDDQWGTAIITLAALKNYLIVSNKKIDQIKVTINGAGAAGLRIADMIKAAGVKNCILCDSKGAITTKRKDINKYKALHAIDSNVITLLDAMNKSDVFIGVSKGDCVTEEMILSMNEFPAIFAMANPNPEIKPEIVKNCLKNRKYVLATGRSDYPNQINNVLGFPFIFRGALDVKATTITKNMKIAAADALALLAREKDVPEIVKKAYNRDFEFGVDYLIPTPFDPRINEYESKAVSMAAIKDKVAKITY
jgi:malate dehydrogenase (oxaloacetate-decarboxylating)(NADP+)